MALIKGMIAALCTVSFILGVSLVANEDNFEEEYSKYTGMGFLEDEINDIYKMSVHSKGDEKEIIDYNTYLQVYSEIGIWLSNNASSYVDYQFNQGIEEITEDSDELYVEIEFNEKHIFTFYNNPDLVLENIKGILYNVNNGTMYLTKENNENFTTILRYEDKEHPFVKNKTLYEITNMH